MSKGVINLPSVVDPKLVNQLDKNIPTVTTNIAFILDESGSMDNIRVPIISGFNESLASVRKNFKDLPTTVSFVKFHTNVSTLYWKSDIKEASPLNDTNYKPDYMTALYDAVGTTVTRFRKEDAENKEAYLLIILSDGEENMSNQYNKESIKKLMKEVNKKGNWTITFIGAKNIDLNDIKSVLNITQDNITSFDTSNAGTAVATTKISKGIGAYSSARSSGEMSLGDFYNSGSGTVVADIPEDELDFYEGV